MDIDKQATIMQILMIVLIIVLMIWEYYDLGGDY